MSLIYNNSVIKEAYSKMNKSMKVEEAKKQQYDGASKHPCRPILEAYKGMFGKSEEVEKITESKGDVVESKNNDIEHDSLVTSFMVSEMLKLGEEIEPAREFLEAINEKDFSDLTEEEKVAVVKMYTTFREDAMDSLTEAEITEIAEKYEIDGEKFVAFIEKRFSGEYDDSWVSKMAEAISVKTIGDIADEKTMEAFKEIFEAEDKEMDKESDKEDPKDKEDKEMDDSEKKSDKEEE